MKSKAVPPERLIFLLAIVNSVTFVPSGHAASQVIVWGATSAGQTNVPPEATNVVALAGGDYHCLALQADGTVLTWGSISYGLTNVPSDATNVTSIGAGST